MNLARIIDGHPDDGVALIDGDRAITYGELRDMVARLRGGMAATGIGAGDRVALVLGNTVEFVISYLATLGLGAVSVPLNPGSPAAELERQLATVGALAAVVDRRQAVGWAGLDRATLPELRHVLVAAGEEADGGADARFDDLLAGDPAPLVDVDPHTHAVLMFTSGTAAAPRVAVLSHRNLASNIEQGDTVPVHTTAGDVVYGVLPLYHVFGLNVLLGHSLAAGATIVLAGRWNPADAAATIVARGVTVFPGVPPMWADLVALDTLAPDTFATVRLALSGAARLPVAVATECEQRFGLQIAEGYGLTEASPAVSTSAGHPPRYGSIGRVLDGIQVRLVDVEGNDAPVGDSGEIWIKGPNVFQGYLDDPEATAEVLDGDGWLHTGDLALADPDGWLYLADRAKDIVIVSGFNVHPAEVEVVLCQHPAVAEAGVVGVPHPHTGEAVKAFVVLADDADAPVAERTLIDYAGDHLARYKCPTEIAFVDELPRNLSGKLVRRHLERS